MNEKLKVLLITASFPPDASAGAIRWGGFSTHLESRNVDLNVVREVRRPFPRLGKWSLLASSEPDFSNSDGRRQVIVEKINGFERLIKPIVHLASRLFVPISYEYLSIPRLVREATRAIEIHQPDLIVSTSLPLYTAVGAAKLKKKTGLPLVVELRDPWCTNPLKVWPTRLHHWNESRLEKFVLKTADRVVMNTETAREQLLEARPWLSPEKVSVLTHSFDDSRFENVNCIRPAESESKFTIGCGAGYYGSCEDENSKQGKSLFFRYRLVPESEIDKQHSSPKLLFDAIDEIFAETPELRSKVRLSFMGNLREADLNYAKRKGLLDNIHQTGRLHPSAVPEFLGSCDLLYLTNPVFRTLRSPFIATKTVEYMASRRPTLVVLGESENREMIEKSGMGVSCNPFEAGSIKRELKKFIAFDYSTLLEPNESYIQQFSRSNHTDKLVSIFGSALKDSAESPSE